MIFSSTIIKKIINNDDIANHIYNLYLITVYYNKDYKDMDKQINLFLNYFINKKEYWVLIFNNWKFTKITKNIQKLIINDDILRIIINKNPNVIRVLNNDIRNNEMIIKDLCYYNSYYFKYASATLKFNINFILKLLDINIYIYFFIDENLKSNNEIIAKIKKINPFILLLNC